MKAFTQLTAVVGLLNRNNIDTDQIIPKVFLKRVERSGFGKHAFQDWRFLPNGQLNPELELNRATYPGAQILLTGDNFGCGSSREHAPWALEDYGFRCIIATSFADIFFNNCFKNGMLPLVVSHEVQKQLVAEVEQAGRVEFKVDLASQTVTTPGGLVIKFEVDAFRKESLLHGLDDIGWTLKHQDKITAFEAGQQKTHPWLWA